ncbi:mycofactocin system GMC family oxidoreductase MftG [Kribbella sp. NPDC050124]|uniref:mycofactocin dehydrogenase MftG n=1 Tax=Kribbella sp. NPDC050124 TaxID=3364114 RepID=UPI0037AEAD53
MTASRPEVIVVGAGASGSALAARLADAGVRVLLLEAGAAPLSVSTFPPELLSAGSLRGADPSHPATWAYPATLAPGREYVVIRGRVAGGSTATNAAYFVRARRADFDRWSQVAPEWSYEQCLPLMRRLETDLDFGSSPVHGNDGPMPVSRPVADHPVTLAFESAAEQAGWARIGDKNGDDGPGVGPVPMNQRNGVRWNAALAYLGPRHNTGLLTVRGGCLVTRVVARGGRVRGVLARTDRGEEMLEADEVVLSAGAFGSPHLLMLSGIGPAAHLEAVGVEVTVDSSGVGSAFSDHPQASLSWCPRYPLPSGAATVMQSVLHTPAAEILPLLKPVPYLLAERETTDMLDVLVSITQPRSRGQIRLRSTDPAVPPEIDYGYLLAADDRRAMRDAVREAATLLTASAFGVISTGLTGLAISDLDDDRLLDAWIRRRLGTSVHACGTAPLGPEIGRTAVVNAAGSVYGVQGLRVADTSILPDVPSRGPAATAVLIGERVADLMLRGSSPSA